MNSTTHIEWTDKLRTGVAVIDKQHQSLINILNNANDKLAARQETAVIERITRELLAYAIYHFETEERLIRDSGYDVAAAAEAKAHLQEHRQFSEQVVAMRDTLRNRKEISYESLLAFLGNWLTHHIQATDKRLAEFIAKRARMPPPDVNAQ